MSSNNTNQLQREMRAHAQELEEAKSSPRQTRQGRIHTPLNEEVNKGALRDKLFDKLDDAGVLVDDIQNVQVETTSGYHPLMLFVRFRVKGKFNLNPLDVEDAVHDLFPNTDNTHVKADKKDELKVRLDFYIIRT